ncbi:MAG: GspH/FimT family pseudopilin [Proteobacteria bacterium]|nr:GspH/FimT family pseudopilin [Pseudomonadota bacterium]
MLVKAIVLVRPRCPRRRLGGFTLIELMVTFVVVAVMLTLAAPSFVTFQKNSQLRGAANAMLSAVTAGRAEAMKRQLNVYLRPGSPTAPSDDWAQGWYLYVDGNWDHVYSSDAASQDVLLSTQDALPPGVVAQSKDYVASDGTSHFIAISGAGFAIDGGGALLASQSISFTNGTDTRLLVIDGSGRLRVCVPPPGTPNSPADPSCGVNQL